MDTFQFGEWASLSETLCSGRSVSFFPSVSNPASLLPRHPPPFSKVYLFRETFCALGHSHTGWEIDRTGVFLCSLSFCLWLYTGMSEVPRHTSSQHLSSAWWRGVRLCLQFAIFTAFSGWLWKFADQMRVVPARLISQTTVQKHKLIAIITGSVARESSAYVLQSCLQACFSWLKLLFLLIHQASHLWESHYVSLCFMLDRYDLLSFVFCFLVLLPFLSAPSHTCTHLMHIH